MHRCEVNAVGSLLTKGILPKQMYMATKHMSMKRSGMRMGIVGMASGKETYGSFTIFGF